VQGRTGNRARHLRSRPREWDLAAIFFLIGREKNAPGADFSDSAVEAAKIIGASLQSQPLTKIDEMTAAGSLKEICDDKAKH
jgi:hypothetical protein